MTSKVDIVFLPSIRVRCDLCKKAYPIVAPDDWSDQPYVMHDLVRAMGWWIVPTPIRLSTHVCPACQGTIMAWLVTRVDLLLEDAYA